MIDFFGTRLDNLKPKEDNKESSTNSKNTAKKEQIQE